MDNGDHFKDKPIFSIIIHANIDILKVSFVKVEKDQNRGSTFQQIKG